MAASGQSQSTVDDELWRNAVTRQQQELLVILEHSDFNTPSLCFLLKQDRCLACPCALRKFKSNKNLHNRIKYALYTYGVVEQVDENDEKVVAIEYYITCVLCGQENVDPDEVDVGVVFVFIRDVNMPIPVFHISLNGKLRYIDDNCRLYKSWDDYVRNNTLPKGDWCYPKNGVYTKAPNGVVDIVFGRTPASKFGNRLANTADYGAMALTIGANITGVACAAPLVVSAATAVGVAALAYSGIRAVSWIVDKCSHGGIPDDEGATAMSWYHVIGFTISGGFRPMVRAASARNRSTKLTAQIWSSMIFSSAVSTIPTREEFLSTKEVKCKPTYLATRRKAWFYFNICLTVFESAAARKNMKLITKAFGDILSHFKCGALLSEFMFCQLYDICEGMMPMLHVIYNVFVKCLYLAPDEINKVSDRLKEAAEKLKDIASNGSLVNPSHTMDTILSKLQGNIGNVLRDCYTVFCNSDYHNSKLPDSDNYVRWLCDSLKWLNCLFDDYKIHQCKYKRDLPSAVSSPNGKAKCVDLPVSEILYLFPKHLYEDEHGRELSDEFCKRIALNALKFEFELPACDIIRVPYTRHIHVILKENKERIWIRLMFNESFEHKYMLISVF